MSSNWGNFLNWLNSPQGWIFYVLVLVLILSILVNLVVFMRRIQKHGWGRDAVWSDVWRMMAIAGGFITLLSVFLPGGLFSFSSSSSVTFAGLFLAYLFGLFWLTFFAVPRKVTAIMGVIWGSCALVLISLQAPMNAAESARVGAYVSILGSVGLIVGSAFVYVKARNAAAREPGLLARPLPPVQ